MNIIEFAIQQAEQNQSKLPLSVYQVAGYAGNKNRIFLNAVAELAFVEYGFLNFVNVGAQDGASIIAASYKNQGSFITIDDHQYHGSAENLKHQQEKFRGDCEFKFIEGDFRVIDHAELNHPINVLFYDGDTNEITESSVLSQFEGVLADKVIYIVDDWNDASGGVKRGAELSVARLNYDTVFFVEPAPFNQHGDSNEWWDGIGVYLLRKKSVAEEVGVAE